MQLYKLISIFNVFIIYLIAFIPSFFILIKRENYANKVIFIKKVSVSIFIEIILFVLIHIFAENIISLLSQKPNIQNYTLYCLKILFIASSITVLHFAIPLYFCFNKKTKKGITLFLLKMLYLPIMFLGYVFFNTKGIYFAVPLCDILYISILFYIFQKS